ncbi:hypothetical protein GOP47_0001908 [Adiantum capillus-veneris]|uniref:Subtilisin-like protease SBT2.5 n=1 Tax=Adiantum capillus-veneris TaxID=13818 RepID=A0A9D4ZR50_ADICA|nr:hypothetical protein GOP47_0001908 [Adiantum capillus-veneris]
MMVGNNALLVLIGLLCTLLGGKLDVQAISDVHIVLLEPPSFVQRNELLQGKMYKDQGAFSKVRDMAMLHRSLLEQSHNNILQEVFGAEAMERKLYSYTYLVNGFAATMSSQEAAIFRRIPKVIRVEKDSKMEKLTTYTPTYLGLPYKAWGKTSPSSVGGAGEGIVIGMVDTGIDPSHPSFANTTSNPYYNPKYFTRHFKGECEAITNEDQQSFCNGKIVAAHHFAKAAKRSGLFNPTVDYDSPFDGDGHGTHTSSIAAGNYGTVVQVAGMIFGNASGMAPRARLAIYKALYPSFGGFYSDVVAAIEKAVEDGVDILNLSIGPSRPPRGVATFFNVVDLALLVAVKAGVFVVQAAGNLGSSPFSVVSFSPWIFTVAATRHDRTYPNSIILGNNSTINGLGLSLGTKGTRMQSLVLAKDAARNYTVEEIALEECQGGQNFEKDEVEGKILVCTFTLSFLIGRASVKNVEATAKELSASGVIFTISSWMQGINLHVEFMPVEIPMIIIPSASDSKALLDYCTGSSLKGLYEQPSGRIVGANARYSHETPRVASYSSRGPDPATFNFRAADVLKPNIAAPGSYIWGAWTPHGVDAEDFEGEKFALLSGTSMATPHIAGIAALVKQSNPDLSVSGIASALSTTAIMRDGKGSSLLTEDLLSPKRSDLATPFDVGCGLVNATAAMNPGLIFNAGYKDYVRFLCAVDGAAGEVKRALGKSCASIGASKELATNLNAPYITIAALEGRLTVIREVMHVGNSTELYEVSVKVPEGVSLEVSPSIFMLDCKEAQRLEVTVEPSSSRRKSTPSFGSILFKGSHGHSAQIPVVIISTSAASGKH